MPENDFQKEVIDRLARIETKQDATGKTLDDHCEVIRQHSDRITVTEESTKAAHHRIDGIFLSAGTLGAMAGGIANVFAAMWTKHGP